ncbi:short-chain dehydrogenase [Burkholderia cepacia]|uniref:SDR family NAD(P)-dependent oxidoreductase n=1 Tax=Burkholderia TaxID=32008 RepID=UPI00075D0BE1|nr:MULTISPECIES: SDR family oxidoreductase [Burkholderia]KVA52961.1 short-chain dehydrogenase [Burkholderia cepacia]KVA61477.1 short-chain dehydrogenase [Burkholderia cepacia]KVA64964.1 short-chain dehydrogenase [Burkholderia cepacia]KVA87222.1 short-chain dehydrogenase [Burkholderia cepacia]KVA89367.1 short-chain dehydrogenase [Burkholderia cepacia]
MTRDCIVVTGASRGIGAAIAHALAEQGHYVACLSRSGALPSFPDARPKVSAHWLPRTADVTRPEDLARVLGELSKEGWRIVGLVNNAGFHIDAPSAELPLDQWHQVMDMNATSVVSACQAAYPHLVSAGNALIVNIGSFFDKLGVKRNLAYCASKAAVGAITRCLAVEWASKGIRVINVAPGYIQTDLNAHMITEGPLADYLEKRIPRGRPGTAEEVGALVATLFTQGIAFLTGETIYVDGGQGIAH